MIHGICRTNLDDYKRETWPNLFVEVPREGDCIESHSGKILRVCKVTQKFNWPDKKSFIFDCETPYIEIELTKIINSYTFPPQKIREDYGH